VKLGLKSFFVAQNDSKLALKYSYAQMQSLMDAIKANSGADILSAPRVVTLAGRQAVVAVTEVQTIAGKKETLGPSIDLLPSISADGVSVDLDAKVRMAVASAQ
jgi:type II secretory pathway component GspD/PulD (secretin)